MWIYADTLKEVEDMESELSSIYRDEVFAEQLVDSLLDGCYPTYEIGGTKFYPSEVVRKLARPLYNQIMIEEIEKLIAETLVGLSMSIQTTEISLEILLCQILTILFGKKKSD